MKKVLLATTALALSAGVAYAEVSVSGSARMGLVHTGKVAATVGMSSALGAISAPGAYTNGVWTAPVRAAPSSPVAATPALIAAHQLRVLVAQGDLDAAIVALSSSSTDDTTVRNAQEVLASEQAALAAALGSAGSDATNRMEYRTRINLTGSGETDSGLSYSATIRLQDSSTVATTNAIGVTVSGAFGSLTFGSSSSAAEYAVGDIAGVGYTGLGGGNDTSFLTGAFAMYSYTAGNVTVYASAGQIDSDDMSIGASFSSNGLTVGAGYEDNGLVEATSASAAYAMGDTKVKVVYMDSDVVGKETGVSVASTMGAVSVAAYYKSTDPVLAALPSVNNYGVGASYDIGGGAAIKGGIAKLGDLTRADLGMTFSF